MDWDLAAKVGRRVAGDGPEVTRAEADQIVVGLQEAAVRAIEPVAETTGLWADPERARTQVVDRPSWIDSNVSAFGHIVEPALAQARAKSGTSDALAAVGSKASGLQLGGVLGWVSGKVLGQYEAIVPQGKTGQLLLVAPNIVEAERKMSVPAQDFRLWVCVHEETHRLQFGAVDWLGGYFTEQVQQMLSLSEVGNREALRRIGSVLAAAARIIAGDRRASIVDAAQSPQQREVFMRLTALMSLLEGHAEHVMDAVGPELIPSIDSLRSAFDDRRANPGRTDGLLRRLLGMDAKMKQYTEGRQFVDAVVSEVGMADFNLIWTEPQTLPTVEEIAEPQRWIARVPRAS